MSLIPVLSLDSLVFVFQHMPLTVRQKSLNFFRVISSDPLVKFGQSVTTNSHSVHQYICFILPVLDTQTDRFRNRKFFGQIDKQVQTDEDREINWH